MKYIVSIAVIAVVLLQASGAVPQASVGGAMTLAMVYLAAALAVAIYEAWSNRRGVLGWIVNIVLALVGAFIAIEIANLVFELALVSVRPEGPIAQTPYLMYAALAAMMLVTLLGAWTALWLVNRVRTGAGPKV